MFYLISQDPILYTLPPFSSLSFLICQMKVIMSVLPFSQVGFEIQTRSWMGKSHLEELCGLWGMEDGVDNAACDTAQKRQAPPGSSTVYGSRSEDWVDRRAAPGAPGTQRHVATTPCASPPYPVVTKAALSIKV